MRSEVRVAFAPEPNTTNCQFWVKSSFAGRQVLLGAKETSTKSKGYLVEASVRRWIAIIKGIIRSDEEKLIKA